MEDQRQVSMENQKVLANLLTDGSCSGVDENKESRQKRKAPESASATSRRKEPKGEDHLHDRHINSKRSKCQISKGINLMIFSLEPNATSTFFSSRTRKISQWLESLSGGIAGPKDAIHSLIGKI